MTNVHQCEVMDECSKYILVDEYHVDSLLCETYIYEIETTQDKAEGNRVHWLHCPYCGKKLTTD
jgi:hypothetical protein